MIKLQVSEAIRACLEKKAEEITILGTGKRVGSVHRLLRGVQRDQSAASPGHCRRSGTALKGAGLRPTHIEGYRQAEWVLLDYVDFVVHIFSEKARKFYDLERLWKSARRMEPAELVAGQPRKDGHGARREEEAGLVPSGLPSVSSRVLCG